MRGKSWTLDENNNLYENWDYYCKNKEIAEAKFGRSWHAMKMQAKRVGVERRIKLWTLDENDNLYENWDYYYKNREIAKAKFNTSWGAIRNYARSLGVENHTNFLTSNPMILNEARNYIDGLVIGDGGIICNNMTGNYTQGCKNKGWLDKISEDLFEFGIENNVSNGRLVYGSFSALDGSPTFDLWTRRYIEFREMYDRFYIRLYDIDNYSKTRWHKDKNGEYYVWKKIVPKDICLSPVCIANWHMGDGYIGKLKNRNDYRVILATNGFLREDTIFLAELLDEVLNIDCTVQKDGTIGIFKQSNISTFFNYIKDCKIPSCYDYKFPKELMR